jgi:hypothetical protein
MDFIGEYTTFPKGKFCDILDALAYAPQVLRPGYARKDYFRWAQLNEEQLSHVGRPYSVMIQ